MSFQFNTSSVSAANFSPEYIRYKEQHEKYSKLQVLGTRKNLDLVYELLSTLQKEGKLKPGSIIDTAYLYQIIKESKMDDRWDRDAFRADDDGIKKSLGDLLGGHGLKLRKLPGHRRYLMPDVLPEVWNDRMYTLAVYK